jgi:pyruvate,water dikinase
VRSLFSKFRRILELNTRALETMAEMERALGGDYIFDQAFLEKSVTRLATLAHQVVYSLNALSGDRHLALLDRYQAVRTALLDVLAGGLGPAAGALVLDLDEVHWEMAPLTGLRAVCLAEARRQAGVLGVRPPDGFVVTAAGCAALLEVPGAGGGAGGGAGRGTVESVADHLAGLAREGVAGPGLAAMAARLVRRVEVPEALARALADGVRDLFARRGGPCALHVAVGPAGGGHGARAAWTAPGRRRANVAPEDLHAALLDCLADGVAEALERADGAPGAPDALATAGADGAPLLGQWAVAVTAWEPGRAAGRVRTLTAAPGGRDAVEVLVGPAEAPGTLGLDAAAESPVPGGGPGGAGSEAGTGAGAEPEAGPVERYLLRRTPPHELVFSRIAPKPLESARRTLASLAAGEGLRPGAALLSLARLTGLAAAAMGLERLLGLPQEILFTDNGRDGAAVLDVRPLPSAWGEEPSAAELEALERELAGARVLLSGGETAQSGVAAGRVVHVDAETPAETFPLGGVAVARFAAPQLSPLLRRAAALVTEVGGTMGHLATIAREYRVPAVVGASGALARLPQGAEVTVDAEEDVVYAGALQALLRFRASGVELYPTDPEYVRLRLLLRLITPLHLLDPESPEFAPEHCRSVHDLIHFAHERAVGELLDMQARLERRGGGAHVLRARRLDLDVPLDVRVLDVEGATIAPLEADTADSGPLTLDRVRCIPLRAFARGLSLTGMWNDEPRDLRLRDVFLAMGRNTAVLPGQTPFAGRNLAIVGGSYLNLSLRLGYHFSVVDAFVADNADQNTVYFRFVGGLADERRRRRRAELIRTILDGLEFSVAVKGDLVVGRRKYGERAAMEAVLARLGALTAFTRQLDVAMREEDDVRRLSDLFVDRLLGRGAETANEPDPNATGTNATGTNATGTNATGTNAIDTSESGTNARPKDGRP